jgi:hypothetical protein
MTMSNAVTEGQVWRDSAIKMALTTTQSVHARM